MEKSKHGDISSGFIHTTHLGIILRAQWTNFLVAYNGLKTRCSNTFTQENFPVIEVNCLVLPITIVHPLCPILLSTSALLEV